MTDAADWKGKLVDPEGLRGYVTGRALAQK